MGDEEHSWKPGLYIHVPFCSSVCPYCDFAVTIAGEKRRSAYVAALALEARIYARRFTAFDTVYFGGGTPSSLDIEHLQQIIEVLQKTFLIDGARFYIEANPEDVSIDRAVSWRRLGFETVSLGVQSFDDRILAELGRHHDSDCAIRAIDILKCAGFDSVSIDLIFGMSGLGLSGWRKQIDRAVALEVDHLSCYQLTIHEHTLFGRRFHKGTLHIADNQKQGELFLATHRWLEEAGYEGYEVSSFARTKRYRSRHNIKYWNRTNFLGIGPSAHSYLDDQRWWNRKKLRMWQRDLEDHVLPVEGSETLGIDEIVLETVMLGLRTRSGVDCTGLEERFGINLLEPNLNLIAEFTASGLVEFDGRYLRPTTNGFAVADGMARKFVIGT